MDTLTEGFKTELTLMVMPELTANVEEAQTAFELNSQVTISEFAKVLLVKLELFVPAFDPLIFH